MSYQTNNSDNRIIHSKPSSMKPEIQELFAHLQEAVGSIKHKANHLLLLFQSMLLLMIRLKKHAMLRIKAKIFNFQNSIKESSPETKMKEFYDEKYFLQDKSEKKKESEILGVVPYDISQFAGLLKDFGKNWNINMFFLQSCTNNMCLQVIGKYCINFFNLTKALHCNQIVISSFLNKVGTGYNSLPFHNSIHASDVLCSYIYLISNSQFISSLSTYELLASIIACLSHDLGHPGFTNRFLITDRSDLSIKYNTNSVLETMHCAKAFEILNDEYSNILFGLDLKDLTLMRKHIVEIILATDMGKHFEILENFQFSSMDSMESRLNLTKLIVKAADIGHSAKNRELHEKWSYLIIEEFFHQGDVERDRGYEISMCCNRDQTDIAKSQTGFLKHISLPLYEAVNVCLNSNAIKDVCIWQIKENIGYWKHIYYLNFVKMHISDDALKELQKFEVSRAGKRGSIASISEKRNKRISWFV